MAAQFKYIQPAIGNKPQLTISGDTTSSRTPGFCIDPLAIVNNDIVSSSADHHYPLAATAPVFTPSASSPSAILAPDTIINVLNSRVNRHADAIRRATNDGLHPVNVVGDGACMFRAVCLSDSGSEDNHLALRAAAVDYMRNNAEDYAPFGSLDPDENLTFDKYLERISKPSQEVGEFVLGALASVLNKCINLYFADCSPWCYFPISNAEFIRQQQINILHYDLLGSHSGHYMSLLKDRIVTDTDPDIKSGHA